MMVAICCIKGCEKEVVAMGLCVNHWRMNKKHGSPVAERPLHAILRGKTAEERFWHSVEKLENGCWNWVASKDKDGYGRFRGSICGTEYQDAHRFSWALHTGEVLSRKIFVLHKCDNQSCVNPDHLVSGTAQDNSTDMVNKNRQASGMRNARANTKFTEEIVRLICADPRPYEEIAKAFSCHKQSVVDMKRRRTWKFLQNVEVKLNKRGCGGESRSQTLTESDVREIRASTETGAALAKKYNLSQQTVCDIRKLRSWKSVH